QSAHVIIFYDSPRVFPGVDFGVSISKGEATGSVVKAGGPVDPLGWSGYTHSETGVINAGRIFVEKNKGHCRTRHYEIREFPINVIRPTTRVAVITVKPGTIHRCASVARRVRIRSDSLTHGKAANTRGSFA